MRISLVTVFPEYFDSPLSVSLVARAVSQGYLSIDVHDPRDFATGTHRQVDDAPFGGGAGMVMMPEPLAKTLESLKGSHRVLFTPAGRPLTQSILDRFAVIEHLTLVCGRYEGIDERIAEHFIEEEISIGDYVLLGGEVAAAVVIEGITRLLPGVVGNPVSIESESFRGGLLEEPQYTRPANFRGWEVPDVLLSGDHGRIATWREKQRKKRTAERRPDLLENGGEPLA